MTEKGGAEIVVPIFCCRAHPLPSVPEAFRGIIAASVVVEGADFAHGACDLSKKRREVLFHAASRGQDGMPALASILPDLEQADGVNRAFDQIDRGCLGDLANPETPRSLRDPGDMPVKRDPSSRRMVPFSSAPVTSTIPGRGR